MSTSTNFLPETTAETSSDPTENTPITETIPSSSLTNELTEIEAEFNRLCAKIKRPIQTLWKDDINWKRRKRLHFWHSLAFVLRSEQVKHIAVSSFIDDRGEKKLYITSATPINESQKSEMIDIINMILDMKSEADILAKVLPRHLPNIIDHFDKSTNGPVDPIMLEFPAVKKVKELVVKVLSSKKYDISLEDMWELMQLTKENSKQLHDIENGIIEVSHTRSSTKMAHHLCKVIKVWEELQYVIKQIERHKNDSILQSLSRDFEFVSSNCHPELAMLKIAKDCCKSEILRIGLSKRPCYCCTLFMRTVQDNQSTSFKISAVECNGKLCKWPKLENCFENEVKHVWISVIETLTEFFR